MVVNKEKIMIIKGSDVILRVWNLRDVIRLSEFNRGPL